MEPDLLAEPLAGNARRARELAPELCAPAGAAGCAWYHGAYPTLRLLGLVATPERHAAFYARSLGTRVGAAGFRRIFVSGAADTAMLAIVLRAAGPAAHALRVTVADRCRTPLALCDAFAARTGRVVESRVLDLLAPAAREAPAAPFDLACTHSLLVLVPPERRPELVAAWRAQLRPGGVLVSTARLEAAATASAPDAAAADAFAERALGAATSCPALADVDAAALAALARGYAERLASWPLPSTEALASLLETGGFALERLERVEIAGALAKTGTGTARSAAYAEFVALRR